MRDKNKRGDQDGTGSGGRIRGARKNIVGSDSQMLLQAAASAGFIGFSAFQSQSSPSGPAALGAADSPEGGLSRKSGGLGGGKSLSGQVFRAAGVYGVKSGPGQVLPPHYSGGDSHLAVVSKRLAKRDVTTKIKALAELRAMCRLVTPDLDSVSTPPPPARRSSTSSNPTVCRDTAATSSGTGDVDVGSTGKFSTGTVTMGTDEGSVVTSAEALGGFAPHWVFLYQRLSTEGDRRTREAANTTLHCMMKANRRAFQPLLRSLLGPWCCSQADTAAEVSYAAKEAYEAVFPEAKRTSVLGRCADGVLRYLATALRQTPAMLEETSGCTPEEAEKRAERLTVSALSALANFMETVGAESNDRLSLPGQDDDNNDEVDDGATVAEQEATYWSVANKDLWSRLGDPRPTVRRATYALVSSCCRNAPRLLRPRPPSDTTSTTDQENAEDVNVKEHAHGTCVRGNKDMCLRASPVATPALLVKLLSEKEVFNQREAWQAALLVMKEFKDTWRAEKGAEMVLPTLLSRLRKGSFLTSSRTSYPCLLPFIASLSLETLCLPADARIAIVPQNKDQVAKTIRSTSFYKETAFCVEFLEAVLSPLVGLSPPGGSAEWLVDVASAHVECAAFLLLKLPPLTASGTAAEDPSALAVSAGITAAVTNLARATRGFVLDHTRDERAEPDETHEEESEIRPMGLRKMLRNAEESSAVRDAFGRALGQLHLGAERGAGLMGTIDGSTMVWGALLEECISALDQRSHGGVQWMSDTLVYALEVVNARHDADNSRSASTADGSTPEVASSRLPGRDGGSGHGVSDLCRALFRHCAESLCQSSGGETARSHMERVQAAITQRDAPLVTFMASMARALGLRNSLLPASSALIAKESRISSTFNINGREFFDNLLVQCFAATAAQVVVSIDGTAGGVEAGWEADTTAKSGLQELVEIHLTESDRANEDFKLLVQRALLQPPPALLEATTMTLRLVPREFSECIPELEDVLLAACGLPTTGDLSPVAQPCTSLPLFLRACLGVWDARTAASPFISSSAVVQIADAAIATASSYLVGDNASLVPAAPSAACSVRLPNQALALLVIEGLLGVLAARRVPPSASYTATTTNSQQALDAIDERWLGLLLAAFRGCGEGGSAERLWRDSGVPALEHILAASATNLHEGNVASSSPNACRGAWQAFMEGAVDFTRWVMEGGENNDDFISGGDVSVMESAERAATLTLALIKTEQKLLPKSARNNSNHDAEAAELFIPVLWRLGLTQPALWQRRRTEAIAGATTAAAAELARSCVSSRWGRRWACLSVILNGLPSARSRLMYFLEGVRGVRAVGSLEAESTRNLCGMALQEAVTAGVVVSAAIRLIRSERIDSAPAIGPDDGLADLKWDDLPPGLRISPPPPRTGKPNRESDASAGGGSSVLEDFGVGLPNWRGLPTSEGAPAALAAGVMAAALTHLAESGATTAPGLSAMSSSALVSSDDEEKRGDVEVESRATTGACARRGSAVAAMAAIQHPFSLLLPTDLWPVAFEPLKADRPVPDADARPRQGSLKQPGSPKPLKPAGSLSPLELVGSSGSRSVGHLPVVAASFGADDVRLHALLVSAVVSAAAAMADDAATVEIRGDEAAAWWMSCAVEVTAGLLTSVVGEAFSLGLGLGAEANRLMAMRCGVYKPSALSPADLVPGAKILYTREGQAVTVVAAHDDDGSGVPYYTVRTVAVAGSDRPTGQEKQTVLDRLFLSPPGVENAGSSVLESCPCPWRVKPAVSSALAHVIEGPLLAIERSLRRSPRLSSSGRPGTKSPALATAAGAALRSCASTCVRALLLCSDAVGVEPNFGNGDANGGTGIWDRIEPKIIELRNWWASAAVTSGSRLLAATAADDGGEESARAVTLCTAILSGFLAGTPLIYSDEPALKLLPARLEAALLGDAEIHIGPGARIGSRDSPDHGDSSGRNLTVPAHGWGRTQALSSLQWMRDATDASCKIHVCPSQASIDGTLVSDTQTAMEAAVVALVRASLDNGWGGGALDLALARAAAGLFAAEAVRVGRGKGVSLSSKSKAAVISWAVSKFLFSGSRIAARSGRSGASPSKEDESALCLESARLLTATAWGGRKGWGGDGSVAFPAPARRLVAGPREVSEIWAAARAPAAWCGLHAAVVGAVVSPTIQMCAFEVLEAAAAGWECAEVRGTGNDNKDEDAADLVGAGEQDSGEDLGQAQPSGGTEGGQSIVSRLASALGGWGLAAIRSGGDGSGAVGAESGGNGGGGLARPSAGEHDGDLPGADAVREEAQEQQDDLELVARCFPEELLLAVEAIPTTIESLRREGRQKPPRRTWTPSNSDEEETSDEPVEDEDEAFDDSETEGDTEYLEDDQDTDNDEAGAVGEQHERSNMNNGDNSGDDDTGQERAHKSQDLQQAAYANTRQPSGRSKSRRSRRRKRSEIILSRGSESNVAGSRGSTGRGQRNSTIGPPLTAPFLTWLLWLEHCRRASEAEKKSRAAARAFVVRAGTLKPVLDACFRVLRALKSPGRRGNATMTRLGPAQVIRVSRLDPTKPLDLARLALAVYFRTVHVFPALTRSWWADDCVREMRVWVAEFTQRHVSPALIQIEADIIADANLRGIWDEGGQMTVRASATSRQVVASYVKEECTLEACIQLPPEYPLRNVEVTCSRRMGVSESRWRRWVLQIVTLLSLQDGSVLDAVMLWKKNVDKEFEGVEPCVICYGILHPRDMARPQMSCKTCKNRFHSTCLYKWFHTSRKSKCPICQQTWA